MLPEDKTHVDMNHGDRLFHKIIHHIQSELHGRINLTAYRQKILQLVGTKLGNADKESMEAFFKDFPANSKHILFLSFHSAFKDTLYGQASKQELENRYKKGNNSTPPQEANLNAANAVTASSDYSISNSKVKRVRADKAMRQYVSTAKSCVRYNEI